MSPLPFLVVVVGRACACARTGADECTLSTANQRARTCADGSANADTLRRLLFPGFRISVATSVLPAGNRDRHSEREHQ